MQVLSCPYKLLTRSCSKKREQLVNSPDTTKIISENIVINYNIAAAKDWVKIAQNTSLFLQPKYLKAIENCPPKDMQFAYLTFYKENKPCGIAYAQIFKFSTYES